MAEYYPLLAKAVGSLPNSTPDTRRVVYERARKALIGQLRTLHPPIPDEDIEKESVALDKAIERLEGELATGTVTPPTETPQVPPPKPPEPPKPSEPVTRATPDSPKPVAKPPLPVRPPSVPAGNMVPKRPIAPPPLRPKGSPSSPAPDTPPAADGPALPVPTQPAKTDAPPATTPEVVNGDTPPSKPADDAKRGKIRPDPLRPIAPQPPAAKEPKRRLWIIPLAIFLVVAGVAYAAWKLRDRPETIARKQAEPTQTESGKIAERVGGPAARQPAQPDKEKTAKEQPPQTEPAKPAESPQPAPAPAPQPVQPAPSNPEVPVAHRAALLVEAPDEPNKVKTYLGTVVWKLNNAPQGPSDSVGLAVEADIDLPDDKMKAVVTFAKNTEASLPASHTINVRFTVAQGSPTGDVKQISVPQMRPEANPSGEPLAGVTVQIVPNSFLVGLSPGNAEAANVELLRKLQWVDIPMLLDNGKIAKLTFEKSDSGTRDLNDALEAWSK